MQRVRTLLPFVAENGWEAAVLSVAAEDVAAPLDEWLQEDLPADVPVHRARALPLALSRLPGLGTLGFRALGSLRRTGDRILATKRFDLVYFSTTVFEVLSLGVRWKEKFGVPFIIDYQDPWVNDYYRQHPAVTPPGGRLKYAVVDRIHRKMERTALGTVAGITAVSRDYPAQIARRYREADRLPTLVEPFPAPLRDFERLRNSGVGHVWADADGGSVHWVCAGVFTPPMLKPIRAFFSAVRSAPASLRDRLKIHFIGTAYAAGSRECRVAPIAADFNLASVVGEVPGRIPYSQALRVLLASDALLAFGSDDPGYTASKLYPCILARKPLLTIFHEQSPVNDLIANVGGAVPVSFNESEGEDVIAPRIDRAWLSGGQYMTTVPTSESALAEYSDRASARRLLAFLAECTTR